MCWLALCQNCLVLEKHNRLLREAISENIGDEVGSTNGMGPSGQLIEIAAGDACTSHGRTEKNPLFHFNKIMIFMLNRTRVVYIHHDGLFRVKQAIRFSEQI